MSGSSLLTAATGTATLLAMRVRLLGAVSAQHDGAELALGGLKQRAVFALLASSANRVVSVERLIGEVWPDEPPAHAIVALRSYISRLRRVLSGTGSLIVTKPPGWSFQVSADQVDAIRFARLVSEARARSRGDGDLESTGVELRDALALWSGEPLADLAPLDFARSEAVRLTDLRQEAVELLLEIRLATGDTDGVIEESRQLVRAQPFRERTWCTLMLALYRNGRQSDALAAYGELRRLLSDELGLDPSPQARDLESRILQQDPGLQLSVRTRTSAPVEAQDQSDAPSSGAADPVVRVVIADDHQILREGLAMLLHALPGIDVVGSAADGAEAVDVVSATAPDVVIMDIQMPRLDGLEATRQILAAHPAVRVVMLTMNEDDQTIVDALRSGARGYLLKGASAAEVQRAILTAAEGGTVIGASLAGRLAELLSLANRPRVDPFPDLTERERSILDLLAAGRSNAQIAQATYLSDKSVRNVVSGVYAKLHVSDRADAIIKAREAGVGRS